MVLYSVYTLFKILGEHNREPLANMEHIFKMFPHVKRENKTNLLSEKHLLPTVFLYILNNHRSFGLHDIQVQLTFSFKKSPVLYRLDFFETGMSLQLWDFQRSACTSSSSSATSSSASASPPGGMVRSLDRANCRNCRIIPLSKTSSETYSHYIWFILDISGCNYRDKNIETNGLWVWRRVLLGSLSPCEEVSGVLERCELFCC